MTPEQLEQLKARATRPRRTVPIVCDGDLRQRIQDLDAELDSLEQQAAARGRRLNSRPDARVAEVTAELDRLYEQAAASTLHVVVEGLPATPWRALIAEHPAGEDAAGLDKQLGINRLTLEEPLLRASIIGHRPDPDSEDIQPLTPETVDWLIEFVNVEQRETLFLAAWAANRGDDAIPLRRTRSATVGSASA